MRAAQYLVLLLAVGALVVLADWQRIGDAFFDVDVIGELFPEIITVALKNTVLYTLCAFAFGLVLAHRVERSSGSDDIDAIGSDSPAARAETRGPA